jgi:hypothetical protein
VDLIAACLILAAACAASSAKGQQAMNGASAATASVADTLRESAAGTVPRPPIAYTPAAPPASYVAPGKSLLSVNTVLPNVEFNALSEATVQDIHLRPLYTTAIRLPHPVTTVAVGAPTLFEAEHNDQDPELVFVKPSTHDPAQSNLLVAMVTGETVSVRLLSPGDAGSADPVDFVVNYRGKRSLFGDSGTGNVVAMVHGSGDAAPLTGAAAVASPLRPLDATTALAQQGTIAAPHWYTAHDLAAMIKANALAPNNIAISVGEIRQDGDEMVVSFSVLNISDHWIQVMPPQVELANPLASKKDKKKNGTFAEPVHVVDYHLENPKLPPGARADGSLTIDKPDSKLTRESLLLHIATSASIDTPVYCPLPFVAASVTESRNENLNASR